MAPWRGCAPFHSQPDCNAGVNADGDLTHSPGNPSSPPTRARSASERLLRHAALTISPSIATAGRHRRPQKRLQTAANPPSTRIRARAIAFVISSPSFLCSHSLSPCPSVDSGLVAAQSTLEALARWWTGKSVTYEFFRSGFYDELPTAILNAELGKDEAKTVDPDQQSAVLERARKYRNDIDHGQGGRMGEIVRDVVGCQMYYHGLARLLILARLGDRGCDARGNPYGPNFVETEQ